MRYFARQAIFNARKNVNGYELLYRDESGGSGADADGVLKSTKTLDSSLLVGLDVVCEGKRAFVNCTGELLKSDMLRAIPAQRCVLEIVEDVDPEPDVIEACRVLKRAGYVFALDDFLHNEKTAPFMEFASILKIDLRAHAAAEWVEIPQRYNGRFQMLAEKVETLEEYEAAVDAGYELFQGYFFQRPQTMSVKEMNPSTAAALRLFELIYAPSFEVAEIEAVVKTDAALCYRLLRYLNSAVFGLQSGVKSIRHALALLGEKEVRRWLALTTAAIAGGDKPDELLRSALVRARFAESIAPMFKCREYEAFIVGLFSLMEGILDLPLATILKRVELPAEAHAALSGASGRLGTLLKLVKAWEAGEWESCREIAPTIGVQMNEQMQAAYIEAVKWTHAFAGA